MSRKRECCCCDSSATTIEHLTYHGHTTRLELCPRHHHQFQAGLGLQHLVSFDDDTCRRCEGPVAVREEFRLADHDAAWALCEVHADVLHATLSMWVMVGQTVTDPCDELRHRRRTEQVEGRITHPPPATPPKPSDVAAEQINQRSSRLRDTAQRWRISAHARERIDTRGRQYDFTEEDVLRALDAGTYYQDPSGLGRYVREKVSVVVDMDNRTVVTVEPNLPQWVG